jgi:hypothetical protein
MRLVNLSYVNGMEQSVQNWNGTRGFRTTYQGLGNMTTGEGNTCSNTCHSVKLAAASDIARWASSTIMTETVQLLAASTPTFLLWFLLVISVIHEGKALACNIKTAEMRNWVFNWILERKSKNPNHTLISWTLDRWFLTKPSIDTCRPFFLQQGIFWKEIWRERGIRELGEGESSMRGVFELFPWFKMFETEDFEVRMVWEFH